MVNLALGRPGESLVGRPAVGADGVGSRLKFNDYIAPMGGECFWGVILMIRKFANNISNPSSPWSFVPTAALTAAALLPVVAAAGAQASAVAVPSSSSYYVYAVNNNTGSAQTQFQIVLENNETANNGYGLSSSGYVNPFSSPKTSAGYTSGPPAVTDIAYTSSNGSTIASGTQAVFGYTYVGSDVPLPGPTYASTGAYVPVLGMNWGAFNAANATALPVATITYHWENLNAGTMQAGADPYEIITATVANASDPSLTTTEYYEAPFTTGQPYYTAISNNTGNTEIISNARYFVSDTLIPLDQLNNLPANDFTAAPSLDGTYLPNSSSPTPEPASLAMLGVAAAGMLLLRRRRGA